MDRETAFLLISAIIVLIFAIAFGIRFFTSPKEKDKEKAKEFLEGLRDELYKSLVDIVAKFDYTKYKDIAELQMEIIYSVTDSGKRYIEEKIKEAASTNLISALVVKSLDEDFINKFIISIIEKMNIEESIQSSLSDDFKSACEDNEKLEQELTEQFSSNEEFALTEDDVELEPADYNNIPEEELANLNPVREEGEEEYNPDDESMELLTDEEAEELVSDIVIDSKGRARDKSGRFVKSTSK